MERTVKIEQKEITGTKPDQFALQWVLKKFRARYEYWVNGSWIEKPQQKPEGKRIIFDDIIDFESARDVYLTWEDLNSLRIDNPILPETIMARIAKSRSEGNPLMLFSPWGVRPEGNFGEPEITVLNRLRALKGMLASRNVLTTQVIMPADLYATEVNNQVSNSKANAYFDRVADEATRLGFLVKPWSLIRTENLEYYTQRSQELIDQKIWRLLGENIIEEAIGTSKRRSGYKKMREVEQAAFAYLRERICEAEIVEETVSPVKVSLVTKNKDNEVDRNLPRLYVICREERFPWLKI